MDSPDEPAVTRRRAAMVTAVVLATATLTAPTAYGVFTTPTDAGDPATVVEPWRTGEVSGAPAVVPLAGVGAGPGTPACAGAYLLDRAAGSG